MFIYFSESLINVGDIVNVCVRNAEYANGWKIVINFRFSKSGLVIYYEGEDREIKAKRDFAKLVKLVADSGVKIKGLPG